MPCRHSAVRSTGRSLEVGTCERECCLARCCGPGCFGHVGAGDPAIATREIHEVSHTTRQPTRKIRIRRRQGNRRAGTNLMRFLMVGAAGHAQEVAWSLREQEVRSERSCEILFFDDAVPRGPLASGLGDVVGTLDHLPAYVHRDDTALVLGVGLPALKTSIVERVAPLGLPWATVVHPAATVGPNCRIGEGSYVAAGAIVTVNCTVGRFVTINMHCQVAHDDVLEDLVTLHPDTHLGGNVRVEEGAELGAGSIVIPGVTIGARAVLGAGCTVVRSLPGDATYVGVPAAPLLHRARARGGSLAR